MKSIYERANFLLTKFDTEDVITTSGEDPTQPDPDSKERENAYGAFTSFENGPGSWF